MNEYQRRVLEGRKKFLKLQQRQEKELLRIYKQAAKQVTYELSKSKNGTLNQRYLSILNKSIKSYVKELNANLSKSIAEETAQSSNIAAQTQLSFFNLLCFSDKISSGIENGYRNLSSDVVKTLINGNYYADGKSLSQRIWTLIKKNAMDIDQIIKVNVAKGANAGKLAKELNNYIDPENRMTTKTRVPGINKNISYQAQRLARSSLTHASNETFIQGSKRNPFCIGLKWNLSSSHYGRQVKRWGPDECDDYSGKVYEPDDYPVAHPNCLCYPTQDVKNPDEARKELIDWVNGKDNPNLDKWMNDYGGEFGITSNKFDELVDTNLGNNGIIKDIQVGKSLGAKAKNQNVLLPSGEFVKLAEGTKITNVKVIAGKGKQRQIDIEDILVDKYGGDYGNWQKAKGFGYVDYEGEILKAELHWYQESKAGIVEVKVKPQKDGGVFIYED